jgi:hypothetical protein
MDTWSILRSFAIFYGHLVYFVVIWYIFPHLVFCTKTNLATLGEAFETGAIAESYEKVRELRKDVESAVQRGQKKNCGTPLSLLSSELRSSCRASTLIKVFTAEILHELLHLES